MLISALLSGAFAQEVVPSDNSGKRSTERDTIRPPGPYLTDTTLIKVPDALVSETDTSQILQDTTERTFPVSPIDTKVDYEAEDSMRFDIPGKKIYLYGKAKVVYGKITLKAGYIEIDMEKKQLFARGIPDTTGKTVELPVFSESGQEFTSATMLYNFDTQRGLITEVITKEGDGYLHGGVVKKMENNHMFIQDGKYTTCSDPHPHFYIKANKLKVIPDDKIITGPAYLMVEEVPTPLALPFGYFPNKQGRSSGILPPDPGDSPQFGYYLRDGGYYFTISPYVDLSLRGDFYSGGSWGVKAASNYKKRYRYGGIFDVRYANMVTGYREFGTRENSNQFLINWRHNLDPKARPGVSFTADVNGGTSNYNRFNTGTTTDFLNSSMQSNISWSKAFTGTPFMIALNGSHSQNTQDSSITLNVPSATFSMSRIYPFATAGATGKLKWLKKTGINYTGNISNVLNTRDTALFSSESFDRMQNSFTHNAQVSTVVNFRTINFSPGVDYTSAWVLKTTRQSFDPVEGVLRIDTVSGFEAVNRLTFNAPFTTRIYGMYQFKPGSKIEAIRHIITPTIGFRYVPLLNRPQEFVNNDGITQPYSIFNYSAVAPPALIDQGLLTFALSNSLEMKARSAKDTISGVKKFALIDNITASTNYNLFADSLQLAPLQVNGQTNLFNRISINLGGTFDPYEIDTAGRKINTYRWNGSGGLARVTGANLAVGFSFSSKRGLNQQAPPAGTTQEEISMVNAAPGNYVDFDIPWSFTISYNLQYNKPGLQAHTVQGIQVNGDLNLTPKWKIGTRTGYDFVSSEMTYTQVNIYRDLHCWEMRFDWVPFGNYRGYSIHINVKSHMLQDLKLSRKRYWNDFRTFNQ